MRIRARVYREPWGPERWAGEPWLFDVFDEDASLRMDGGRRLLDWGYADSQTEAFDEASRRVAMLREVTS